MLDEFCSLLDNEDFQSLCLTYRRIHRFIDADAAVRYEDKLHETEIWCNHQSLCHLLHLVKIPQFRQMIGCILFYTPGPFPLRPRTRRVIREEEERDVYVDSSEAVELLAECLRCLAIAPNLGLLQLHSFSCHHFLLAALVLVQFPNPCVGVLLEPDQLLKHSYGEFGRLSS